MNAVEELKRLTQNDFLQRFQQLYSRWQKGRLHDGTILK